MRLFLTFWWLGPPGEMPNCSRASRARPLRIWSVCFRPARDRDGAAPVSSRGGEGSSEVLFLRHRLIEPLTLTPADSATPQKQQPP